MLRPLLAAALLGGCTPGPADRDPLDRTPPPVGCDATDPGSCFLPWPSARFTRADPLTETGLRLAIDAAALPVVDRTTFLDLGDGFSRVSGVAAVFDGAIDLDALSWDPDDALDLEAPVQVIVAQPGHPRNGERLRFRTEAIDVSGAFDEHWLVVGRPVEVMPAAADHVMVMLDTLDNAQPAPRAVRVALGLEVPEDPEERALAAWHAPTRLVLDEAGIDPDRVRRVSGFTTRSAADVTTRLRTMMAGIDAAVDDLEVELDRVYVSPRPELDAIVRGRLLGAPSYLDEAGHLALDDQGTPRVVGTTAIEFRLTIPSGDGDYRMVLYGHGTGGDVTDDAFDTDLAGHGIAKLNLQFAGWTGGDLVETLLGFSTFLEGSERSTAGLLQALAGGTALLTAMDGVLGETLAAPTLLGEPNPAAGRYADTSSVAWVGGSMGGTMGAVVVSADERLRTAVLNVPGAGWTHMVPQSLLYRSGMKDIMSQQYPTPLDLMVSLIMAQNAWDDVDGAVWAEEALATGGAFLLQESMEDPILPNLGTELLANALRAVQLEPTLQPISGLSSTDGEVTSGAAITQFRVPKTGDFDVHGFAARSTPAGDAAMEQITLLLESAWAGTPRMRHPEGCAVTHDGSCDFSGMWGDE